MESSTLNWIRTFVLISFFQSPGFYENVKRNLIGLENARCWIQFRTSRFWTSVWVSERPISMSKLCIQNLQKTRQEKCGTRFDANCTRHYCLIISFRQPQLRLPGICPLWKRTQRWVYLHVFKLEWTWKWKRVVSLSQWAHRTCYFDAALD